MAATAVSAISTARINGYGHRSCAFPRSIRHAVQDLSRAQGDDQVPRRQASGCRDVLSKAKGPEA